MNRLNFTPISTERDLRLAVVECGRICYERGLVSAHSGSISARLGDDQVIVSPADLCQGRLEPEDLLVIDLSGRLIKFNTRRRRRVADELPMHLEVYRRRADVRAVVHAQPLQAVALSVAGLPFPVDVMPEVMSSLGPVPTTDFATPGTEEMAAAIRGLIEAHDAILLRNHGSLTVGRDLDEALMRLECLESAAQIFLSARLLGAVHPLPTAVLKNLSMLRQKKGA